MILAQLVLYMVLYLCILETSLNHSAALMTLISLCVPSNNHCKLFSTTSWNRLGQENWLMPWCTSDELKLKQFSCAFWSRKERTAVRATEQFVRWTSGFIWGEWAWREGSLSTNCRLPPLSDARFRKTSWGCRFLKRRKCGSSRFENSCLMPRNIFYRWTKLFDMAHPKLVWRDSCHWNDFWPRPL